ncbi:hypothetical protein AWZ03_008728 [Drosophila navojoa]|uniref:Uncharacterized protein n=1 Tax=Drosophila navojoa TaxID=7232 RepID=A0A484BAJ3_DRONA|nr:hypothetical protein AWZ03_008728 [Drosophila navojoa]
MNNTTHMYYYNDALQCLLVKRAMTFDRDPNIKFGSIRNVDRFWVYTLDVFLKFLEKGDFRPNDPGAIYTYPNETTFYNKIYGNMVERNIYHGNVLLGPPRLRQIRVKDGLCIRNPVFTKNAPTCYAPYSWSGESHASHRGYRWVSMAEDGVTPINGILDWYFGAGFIQDLTYNYTKNVEIITNLRDSEWISRNTRIVIIEFNLYHIMTDLLEIVKLRFEQPSFGGLFPSATFTALRRHSIFATSDWVLQAVGYCYYLMVTLFTVREIAIIFRIGFKKYIRSYFNFTDFTCYLSANELIGFTVVLLIFLMAYAECGLALFGVNDVKFCSLSNALISIMSLAGRKFAYQEITDKNKVKTGIYYISFVLIVYVLLVLHVCLGILVAAYDEVSATLQTKKTKVTTVIRMFFISLYDLLYWLIFRKRRVRKKVDIDAEGEWEVDHHLIPQMVSSLTAKRTHSISDPAFLTQDMYLPLRMKRVSTRLHVLEEVLIPVLKRFLRYYNHLRKAQGLNVILFEQLDVDI